MAGQQYGKAILQLGNITVGKQYGGEQYGEAIMLWGNNTKSQQYNEAALRLSNNTVGTKSRVFPKSL